MNEKTDCTTQYNHLFILKQVGEYTTIEKTVKLVQCVIVPFCSLHSILLEKWLLFTNTMHKNNLIDKIDLRDKLILSHSTNRNSSLNLFLKGRVCLQSLGSDKNRLYELSVIYLSYSYFM